MVEEVVSRRSQSLKVVGRHRGYELQDPLKVRRVVGPSEQREEVPQVEMDQTDREVDGDVTGMTKAIVDGGAVEDVEAAGTTMTEVTMMETTAEMDLLEVVDEDGGLVEAGETTTTTGARSSSRCTSSSSALQRGMGATVLTTRSGVRSCTPI